MQTGRVTAPGRPGLADDEQAKVVRPPDHGFAIDDQQRARFANDPGEPSLGRGHHRRHADRRHVHLALLGRLGRLGQDASRRLRAASQDRRQPGAAGQHRVGALLRLDGQDQPTHHHGGLTDVQTADRTRHVQGMKNVGAMLFARRYAPERPRAQREPSPDFVGALDQETLLLELPQHVAHQGVIAPARGHDRAWQTGQAAHVRDQG